MTIIKVALFFYCKVKKKLRGFGRFLTEKNDFESQNFAVFDLQFLPTKLRCLQKNTFGHTKQYVALRAAAEERSSRVV